MGTPRTKLPFPEQNETMSSTPSYPTHLKDCMTQADELIREIKALQPVPVHELHELTVDGIPGFKKEIIKNHINGWFRSTRVLIESGSGKDDSNVQDFIARGAAPIWGTVDFKTAMTQKLELAQSILGNILQIEELKASMQEEGEITDNGVWSLIHPAVAEVSKDRMEDGYYADAVEAACKKLNSTVRDIVKAKTGEESDGAALMQKAFSPANPIIRLAPDTTVSGQDTQKGYLQIFAGVMTGIRNPKAHENETISKEDALRKLVMISLLMYKIDGRIQ